MGYVNFLIVFQTISFLLVFVFNKYVYLLQSIKIVMTKCIPHLVIAISPGPMWTKKKN